MTRKNEESLKALAMLRYQADKYQTMGNGLMCQQVNAQIRHLLGELDANEAKN